MSEPSCLPPPGTASGTTHVLRRPGGDVALVWREEPERTWWASHVIFKYALDAGLDGYRYLGPLTLPEEVDRLRAENERLRSGLPVSYTDGMGNYWLRGALAVSDRITLRGAPTAISPDSCPTIDATVGPHG